eukprot:gnl/TRDRNA2_/TRDRNA2_27924_c0_seq1.p1 gnl/TRDRNA2_/TRDRNA2_27924_c0~~gnl/TRDRNA2_/TRDRNA2_27924_c0_seq1.p1  ORF type:complete len:323 (+),score=24.12 gnl/TRDRNA2_/TRDRNA2_27924_c0_seq1:27-995(+)
MHVRIDGALILTSHPGMDDSKDGSLHTLRRIERWSLLLTAVAAELASLDDGVATGVYPTELSLHDLTDTVSYLANDYGADAYGTCSMYDNGIVVELPIPVPAGESPFRVCMCSRPRRPIMMGDAAGMMCVPPWCAHGERPSSYDICVCDFGWKKSDPFSYNSVCDSFACLSNSQCEDLLGIAGATCPWPDPFVKGEPSLDSGWPCDCGWELAGHSNWQAGCMSRWMLIRVSLHEYRMYLAAAVALLLFVALSTRWFLFVMSVPHQAEVKLQDREGHGVKIAAAENELGNENEAKPRLLRHARRFFTDCLWCLILVSMMQLPR